MVNGKIEEFKKYVLRSIEYGDTPYLPIDIFEYIVKDIDNKLFNEIESLELNRINIDVTNIGLEFISRQKARRKLKEILKILDKLKQM